MDQSTNKNPLIFVKMELVRHSDDAGVKINAICSALGLTSDFPRDTDKLPIGLRCTTDHPDASSLSVKLNKALTSQGLAVKIAVIESNHWVINTSRIK